MTSASLQYEASSEKILNIKQMWDFLFSVLLFSSFFFPFVYVSWVYVPFSSLNTNISLEPKLGNYFL